jgi:CheY-like chemotaxis protein
MPASGPIIILEDDVEDQEIMADVIRELGIPNEIKFFQSGKEFLQYLRNTTDTPLLILTDINLPVMSGIEVREKICNDDYLRKKSIPYIFLTTSDGKGILERAFDLQVQGFFQKESTLEAMKKQIKQIIDYWKSSKHPNY